MRHQPIRIVVKKKTLVPAKQKAVMVHRFRSDWKQVGMYNYEQTPQIFASIGSGIIVNEAQFCKWIHDTYGEGEYNICAWKKGKEGFWGFLHFVCGEYTFKRVERKMTQEQKEIMDLKADKRKFDEQMKMAENRDEKEEIQEQLSNITEDIELNQMIQTMDNKRGPYPYLKSTIPVGKEHDYESYTDKTDLPDAPKLGYRWI